ncbi:MAG TPA: hypothetical protein VGK33_17920, partial [Chloroflexota bacterium]
MQTLGVTQSALDAQVVLQALLPQRYGAHELEVFVQVPLPSHDAAGVKIDPVQAAAAQPVPAAYFWQAPLPLQSPLRPQVVAPASAHWASGSWPAGTATQVPTEPATAQELQIEEQAVAQQTPWAQTPELQVVPTVHAVPLGARPQLFVDVLQAAEAAQSAFPVQVVLQAVPPALQVREFAQLAVFATHAAAPTPPLHWNVEPP